MAKIAMTTHSSRKIMLMKRYLALLPMIWVVISPMDIPLFLSDMTRAEKSCTPPRKTVPNVTHSTAGTHPQIIPMAGPTIGPKPAMEVK